MSVNTVTISADPEKVWDVLADGWLYALWVVGASRIRQVSPTWPAVGAHIDHSVGVWPALINDRTSVLESEPHQLLRLQARAWPLGEADVLFRLSPADGGTLVEITEKAVKGPGTVLPRPLVDGGLHWRNTETLRRLRLLAQGRP